MRAADREERLRTPLLWAGGALAATAVVHLWDPNQAGSYGLCPLRAVTGWLCPLCGGLRAVHALTHGDWQQAWGLNPAVLAVLPLVVVAWLAWAVGTARGHPPRASGHVRRVWAPWLVLAAMVLFGVLRNVPALAPYLAALT